MNPSGDSSDGKTHGEIICALNDIERELPVSPLHRCGKRTRLSRQNKRVI
jgi:hypothetical protein